MKLCLSSNASDRLPISRSSSGPTALAAAVAWCGRWESAFWLMVGANILLVLSVLLVHRQESCCRLEEPT
jgi:hypothetical protein